MKHHVLSKKNDFKYFNILININIIYIYINGNNKKYIINISTNNWICTFLYSKIE